MLTTSQAILYAELGADGRGPWALQKSLLADLNPHGRRCFAGAMVHAEDLSEGLRAVDRKRVQQEVGALNARAKGHTPAGREFTKSLSALDDMYGAMKAKPIVIKKADLPGHGAETIRKAFDALQHGDLTAEQRGALMLKLSDLNDRVFAKADHPMLARITDIQAALDRALADGKAGDAEGVIREALALIRRGKLTQPEYNHLTLLISEIRSKLEVTNGAKQ